MSVLYGVLVNPINVTWSSRCVCLNRYFVLIVISSKACLSKVSSGIFCFMKSVKVEVDECAKYIDEVFDVIY